VISLAEIVEFFVIELGSVFELLQHQLVDQSVLLLFSVLQVRDRNL